MLKKVTSSFVLFKHSWYALILIYWTSYFCQSVLPPPHVSHAIPPVLCLMQAISQGIRVCFRIQSKLQTSSYGRHCTPFCLPLLWKQVREAAVTWSRVHASVCLLHPTYLSLLAVWYSLVSGELRSVQGWFQRVGELPACTKAVQKILLGKEQNALKNFLQKQPAAQAQRRENLPSEVHCLPH